MKKIIGLFIVMVPLFFSGCNDPEETDCIYSDKRFCDPGFTGGNIGRELVEFSGDTENYTSKVLLEDFTGFRCTNCLPAIATAKNLKDQNPDRLSIIGVHCTPFFAAPITDDPNEPYHKDFRTPEGEFYVEHYGFQQLPTGIVNRQDDGPTATIPFAQWEDAVNSLLSSNSPEVYLEIEEVTVNADSSMATIKAISKPLQISSKNYLINVVVTENGIMEAQKNTNSPGGEILDFIHDHVLRYSAYGPWGVELYSGDVELTENEAFSFELEVELSDEWVLENCELVVYVSNEQGFDVVQVEETHLLE